jgi:VanZ family protein
MITYLGLPPITAILIDTILCLFLRYADQIMKNQQTINSSARRFLVYHLPPILYAALIVAASSLQGLKSPELIGLQLDKLAHFLEYFVFAFLIHRSFAHMRAEIPAKRALWVSFLLIGLFALGDEFYQKFVPNRQSEIPDIIADLLGAILVLFLLWLRDRRVNKV